MNRDDLDWARVAPPVRQTRLQFWLEAQREVVSEKYLGTLAQCETTAEMRFLLPLLQQLQWELVERNHLRHHLIELRVHKEFGTGHFDFLIVHRTSPLFAPVVVEIIRPVLNGSPAVPVDHVQAMADSWRYRVDVVRSADAAARGGWWARLLTEAGANERFQAREVDPRRFPRTTLSG